MSTRVTLAEKQLLLYEVRGFIFDLKQAYKELQAKEDDTKEDFELFEEVKHLLKRFEAAETKLLSDISPEPQLSRRFVLITGALSALTFIAGVSMFEA